MAKQTQKKGFTLVEMLVVIAIIAVLVSIIIPMVGKSTVKSAAATNAANLRSIEGKISTMRVEHPQIFQNVIEKAPNTLLSILNDPVLSARAKLSLAVSMGFDSLQGLENGLYMESLEGGWENWLSSGSAGANYVNYRVFHNTADDNDVITISVSPSVMVSDVPKSKEVSAGDMKIPADVPMTVYISDMAIVATYEYGGQSYTREDFAKVVETGDFSGSGSGGLTGENASGIFNCENGAHTLTDCVCKYCNQTFHNLVEDGDENHKCANNCGFVEQHDFTAGYCSDCSYSKYLDDYYCKEGCGTIAIFDGYCSAHRYQVTCSKCQTVFRAASQNSTSCPNSANHQNSTPCTCPGYQAKSIINSGCKNCPHAKTDHNATGSSFLGTTYDGGSCNQYITN